jgi:hypothetical protein
MTLRWIAADDVAPGKLPEWARTNGEPLPGGRGSVHPEGIVLLLPRKRATAIEWSDVLGVARGADRVLLLAPRTPPAAAWLVVSDQVATRVEALLDQRRASQSDAYRVEPTAPATLAPPEVLRRVIAREPLPGSIEILSPPNRATAGAAQMAAICGVVVAGSIATSAGADSSLPFVLILSLAAFLFIAAPVALLHLSVRLYRAWTRPRILVLTPDGFVARFDGGSPRAIAWRDVKCFRASGEGYRRSLDVVSIDERVNASVPGRLFDVELDVVVALAEAYRKRVTSSPD